MDLKDVKPDNGRLPIFYIKVAVKWRKIASSKRFEPTRTLELVYKGLAAVSLDEDLRKRIFRDLGVKDPSETISKTLVIVNYELLHFLGYEIKH